MLFGGFPEDMSKLVGLLLVAWHVVAEVPSKKEREEIVECHTKLREGVQPTAAGMQLMVCLSNWQRFLCTFYAVIPDCQ
uniref:SCP domain-containing protein n=1 Tax=Mesocestoides corti TaxID=53468 RepID=A0A5K3G2G4_MESCO